jgi:hypothetical protein
MDMISVGDNQASCKRQISADLCRPLHPIVMLLSGSRMRSKFADEFSWQRLFVYK